MVIYLDESGDLGFNFSLTKTSKFFVITALVFKDIRSLKRAINQIEKFKKSHKIEELKGKNIHPNDKTQLHFYLRKLSWTLHAILVDKRKITNFIRYTDFYDELTVKVIKSCFKNHAKLTTINIILDRCKNTEHEMKTLNNKIISALQNLSAPNEIKIHHADSKREPGLQMVDLYSYGIFIKYESGKKDWFNYFKNKINILITL